MQSRPPSVADQTSFCSKHSDEDGDDLKEREFVTVIKIGSETIQSEVLGLSGVIVIKTERSTPSYSFVSIFLLSHVLDLYTSLLSAPRILLSLPHLTSFPALLSSPAPLLLFPLPGLLLSFPPTRPYSP